MRRHLSNRKGFTILEMLLAVTLFAVVMSSSYGIFSMGTQIWRRSKGAVRIERQVLLTMERIGKEMRMTTRIHDEEYAGEGKRTMCKLPAVVAIDDDKGETRYHYGWRTYEWNRKRKTFCVREETHRKLRKKPECRDLVNQVKKVDFEYWVYDGIGEDYSWYHQFDDKDGLPQAIRFTLELEPKLEGEKTVMKRVYERTFLIPVGGVPVTPEVKQFETMSLGSVEQSTEI